MVVRVVVVGVVVRGGLEPAGAPGDRHAQDQHARQGQPVVVVELELRQQVRERDAEEGARGEGQRERRHCKLVFASGDPQFEEPDPERHHHREADVREQDPRPPDAGGPHEHRDRHRIEGLVKRDPEEHPEAREHLAMAVRLRRLDARRKRDAREDRVHREPHHRAEPGDPVRAARRGRLGLVVDVTVPARRVVLDRSGRFMLMEREEPLEQEHHEEAEQQRKHDRVEPAVEIRSSRKLRRRGLAPQDDRVGQHVDHAHAEHDARDEREGQLHAAVAEPHQRRQHAAENGDREDDDAVDEEEHRFSRARGRSGLGASRG